MLCSAPRTEPQLGLTHCLGPVVDVERQVSAFPQQPFKRYRFPAICLPVHNRLCSLLNDARHADARADDGRGIDATVGQHRGQPGQDPLDDRIDTVFPWIKRVVCLGAFGHREVE